MVVSRPANSMCRERSRVAFVREFQALPRATRYMINNEEIICGGQGIRASGEQTETTWMYLHLTEHIKENFADRIIDDIRNEEAKIEDRKQSGRFNDHGCNGREMFTMLSAAHRRESSSLDEEAKNDAE